MERSIFLFTLFCCLFTSGQCLQCYKCQNCLTVKDADLQTCESLVALEILSTPITTSDPSTTSTIIVETTTEPIPSASTTIIATITETALKASPTPPSTSTLNESTTASSTTTDIPQTATTSTTTSLDLSNKTCSATKYTESTTISATMSIGITTISNTTTIAPPTPTTDITTRSTANQIPITTTVSAESTNRTTGPTTTTITPESSLKDKVGDGPLKNQRIKRHMSTIRIQDLPLGEDLTFACVVDTDTVNGTSITRRGCAFVEKDQRVLCEKAGFGPNCRTCGRDKCNGAARKMIQQSLVLLTAFIHGIQNFYFSKK